MQYSASLPKLFVHYYFHLDYKMYKSGGYSGNTYCVDPTYYVQVPRGINANAATTQCCYDYVRDLKKRLGYN